MSFHVPELQRIRRGDLGSEVLDGNNGAFSVPLRPPFVALCIASDQEGWEHVSVSIVTRRRPAGRTPTWEEMAAIKATFWDAEDCVMQLHPPASVYVNHHAHCLHLWRPIGAAIPQPPQWMV